MHKEERILAWEQTQAEIDSFQDCLRLEISFLPGVVEFRIDRSKSASTLFYTAEGPVPRWGVLGSAAEKAFVLRGLVVAKDLNNE